jgi:periplasmic divalent cation tolerance protein
MEIMVVLSTFPHIESARQIGAALVGARLAACVNLCPGVESIYRWKGEVESAAEVLAVIKTTRAGFEALRTKLLELHPYEVPEIIALPVTSALEAYVAWLGAAVSPGDA